LTAEAPNTPDYRRLLALCYRESSWDSSPEKLATAIAMLEDICREFPNHAAYQYDLCVTLAMLDPRSPDLTPEELEVAVDRLARAQQIADQLSAKYPNEPTYISNRVQIHHKLAFALAHQAQLNDAFDDSEILAESEDHYRQAIALQASLVDDFPEVMGHAIWLAILRGSFARSLTERGQYEEAFLLLETTAADLEERLKTDPDQRPVRGSLVFCYWGQVSILTQMGRDDEALQVMERIKKLQGDMSWSRTRPGGPPGSPPRDDRTEAPESPKPDSDAPRDQVP
jgi:tetratricopeptide (TPR) repeat protein